MTDKQLLEVIEEVRKEYQIPPFFNDNGLKNFLQEGEAFLLGLNPGCDLDIDLTYRMLLKTYTYYAYHHKINEWQKNYQNAILNWQLTTEVIS